MEQSIRQFESLVVGQDEPVWSINMKKAVASKLQLHVSGSRSVESASRNFGLPTEDTTEDVNSVFKVFEVRTPFSPPIFYDTKIPIQIPFE